MQQVRCFLPKNGPIRPARAGNAAEDAMGGRARWVTAGSAPREQPYQKVAEQMDSRAFLAPPAAPGAEQPPFLAVFTSQVAQPLTPFGLPARQVAPGEAIFEGTWNSAVADVYASGDLQDAIANANFFCYPDGIRLYPKNCPKPRFFSFVLTSAEGYFHYVYCVQYYDCETFQASALLGDPSCKYRHTFFAPKTIAILCTKATAEFCREWLWAVHGKIVQDKSMACLEQFSKELIAMEMPPPFEVSKCLEVNGHKVRPFLHVPSSLPPNVSPMALLWFVSVMDAKNFLGIFLSLLNEECIIFVSENIEFLHQAVEVCRSIIFPFKWIFPASTVIPSNLADITECPVPFVVGFTRTVFKTLDISKIEQPLNIIDLDGRSFVREKFERFPVPHDEYHLLWQDLQLSVLRFYIFSDLGYSDERTISGIKLQRLKIMLNLSFIRFFTSILRNYRDYVVYVRFFPKPVCFFQYDRFVAEAKEEFKPFLSRFVRKQMFPPFTATRPWPVGDLFDQCIANELWAHDFDDAFEIYCHTLNMFSSSACQIPPSVIYLNQEPPTDKPVPRKRVVFSMRSVLSCVETSKGSSAEEEMMLDQIVPQISTYTVSESDLNYIRERIDNSLFRSAFAWRLGKSMESKERVECPDKGWQLLCDMINFVISSAIKAGDTISVWFCFDVVSRCYYQHEDGHKEYMRERVFFTMCDDPKFWRDVFAVRASQNILGIYRSKNIFPSIYGNVEPADIEKYAQDEKTRLNSLLDLFGIKMSQLGFHEKIVQKVKSAVAYLVNIPEMGRHLRKVASVMIDRTKIHHPMFDRAKTIAVFVDNKISDPSRFEMLETIQNTLSHSHGYKDGDIVTQMFSSSMGLKSWLLAYGKDYVSKIVVITDRARPYDGEGDAAAQTIQMIHCELGLFIPILIFTHHPEKVLSYAEGRANVYITDNISAVPTFIVRKKLPLFRAKKK